MRIELVNIQKTVRKSNIAHEVVAARGWTQEDAVEMIVAGVVPFKRIARTRASADGGTDYDSCVAVAVAHISDDSVSGRRGKVDAIADT